MNREVEERIVAMYFDNKDFEQNAKQTIETLGQLKEGLNLEESAKGFNVFDKIKNAMNFSKANREARNLKNTMTNLTQGIGKVANIGMAPVRALDNLFGTFRGYVSKFIGFDLAGKVVNTLESTLRSFTIAPVSAGWDQYQAKMDSVKTIMSGTGESIEVVEQHLKNLTDYANKTIYSLSDMTSNLGKFTNNGVKLEDATAAMQGIANATADAGQGAQSASMAMYNISQAIGVGKMTTIDWKSLENANIATQKLKNTFLEVAAAGGRIQKETDGQGIAHYWLTKDDDGKALKEKIELTAANFREYLQKGWLDKDTLLKTFQIYSGNGITVDLLKSWGINDVETQKRLMAIGEEALNAAQEVRTFSKMMDALRESAQSGWADSFQIIFGNMKEGTTLWTRLNKQIDEVLTGSAEKRNKILTEWTEMSEDYDSIYNGTDKNGNKRQVKDGGRKILIDSFFEMIDVIKEVGKVFSDVFHKVFGEIDAKKLMDVTLGFRNLVRNAKAWLGDVNETGSRLNKISRILSGVFNVIKIGFNVIKAGFNLVKRLAGPAIDVFLDVFSVIGDFLTGTGELNFGQLFAKIGEGFTKLWEKIKSVFMPRNLPGGGTEIPIIAWIKERWVKLKETVKQWARDNGLGEILDGFTNFTGTILNWGGWQDIANFFINAKDTIVNAWEEVKKWPVWQNIGSFLTNAWNWVLEITGLKPKETNNVLAEKKDELIGELSGMDEYKDQNLGNKGFFETITNGLTEAYDAILGVWNSTVGSAWAQENLWTPIANFFTNIWEWIKEKVGITVDFFTKPDNQTGETGFISWIREVWGNVEKFWNEELVPWATPICEEISKFFTNTWDWICGVAGVTASFFTEPDAETGETGFVTWIKGVWQSIEDFWNTTIMGTARPIWEAIAKFGTDTWSWIVEQFTPKQTALQEKKQALADELLQMPEFSGAEYTPEAAAGEAPIVTWLSGIWDSVKGTWDEVVGWEGWGAIGEFLSNTWGWITGLFSGSDQATAGASEEAIKNAEAQSKAIEEVTKEDGFLSRIIDSVGNFIDKVLSAVQGVVIPPEVTTFLNGIKDVLLGIMEQVGILFESVAKIISGKSGWEDWTNVLGLVLPVIIAKILELINNKNLANIKGAQSFGLKFLEFAGGMFLIASAIALLTTVDQEKMKAGAITIGALALVVGYLIKKLNDKTILGDMTNQDKPVTSWERIVNNLIGTLGKIAMIGVAMKLLPEIIRAIGEARSLLGGQSIGDDLLKTFLGLTALIGVTSIVMGLVQKMTGNQGLSPAAAGKTMLTIAEVMGILALLTLAIGGIGEAADGIFGEGTHEKILGAMEKAKEFLYALGGALIGFFQGIFGIKTEEQKADEALVIFNKIGDSLDGFDLEKISGISRMLTMIQQITDGSIKFDSGKLADFATSMGELGEGIYKIAGYISEVEGPLAELHDPESIMFKKLEGFTHFGQQLGDMLLTFTNVHIDDVLRRLHDLASEEKSKQFVNDLQVMINALGGLDTPDGIQFDGLTIATKLFDAIQDGLMDPKMPAFDATSVVDAIVLALTSGNAAIAAIVHDMVQSGIDLSTKTGTNGGGELKFSVDEDSKNALMKLFSLDEEGADPSKLLNMEGWEKELFGEDGNGGLMGYFNDFENKIPNMEKIFSENFDFTDAEGNSIDVLGNLQTELDKLSETLNNMDPLTVKITPVFDTTNFTPQTLQQQLNTMPIQFTPGTTTSKFTFEFKGLSEELNMTAIYNKLEQIRAAEVAWGIQNVTATNNLGRDIDGIAAEISRMKLYLDTGALVGGILPYVDAGLYKRSVTASRTGTVSMN